MVLPSLFSFSKKFIIFMDQYSFCKIIIITVLLDYIRERSATRDMDECNIIL